MNAQERIRQAVFSAGLGRQKREVKILIDTLELQLSLLRGETPNPIDVRSIGRPGRLRLKIQKKAALSDRLAVNMLAMIATGRLRPGTQVPPERRIANALTASRVCVRSALNRLKAIGYLEAVQGSGTRVVSQTDRIEALLRANRENLDDLSEFCDFLDGMLVERAIANGSDKGLAMLAGSVLQSAPADGQGHREVAWRVHLAGLTGSPVIPLLIQHLTRGLRTYFDAIHRSPPGAETRQALEGINIRLANQIARRKLSEARATLAERSQLLRAVLHPLPSAPVRGLEEDELLRELAAQQPGNLRDTIAREIAGMIATGQLEEGDRLLSERRLADMFGVSRVSVREALAILKQNGLVAANERSGTHAVSDPPLGQLASGLTDVAAEGVPSFRDMCAIRHYLEVWAARRAAVRASEADLLAMRRILAEMRRSTHTPQRRIDLDLNLHLTIARAAGSALHLFVSEVLRNVVMGYFNYSLTDPSIGGGRDALLLEHHSEIVKAITARDAQAAAAAMDRHVGTFRDSYASAVA